MAVCDPQSEWRRVQIYRRITPQQRMLIAAQMYEDGVATARAAILDRRPDISQNELARQLRRRLLSRTLLQK